MCRVLGSCHLQRYMASAPVRLAFSQLRMTFDRLLLGPGTYCPALIGRLYEKVRAWLESAVDPAQAQAAAGQRCTIM